MKILVLNGSPKRDKSDTMHMTRAFLAGMNDIAENDVHIINVIDKHIEYCTGCLSCMSNGGDCVHKDDMRGILEEILESDVLLFSYPLYNYGMPAPLKALMDRTLPLSNLAMRKVGDYYEHTSTHDFSHLRYVMICGCGFPNMENNFEPAVLQFKRMFRGDTAIITVPEAPMFNAPEAEIVTKPFLETVRQAGREYAESGTISSETMSRLATPMIPMDEYIKIVNGKAGQ
ncbi:MAG: flavodoxin family protein [Oscillospiraceae bacterium]